ncbi:unnamed protein product, partial [Brachionus calyciflorus]
MSNDIKQIIKECTTFQRNNKCITKFHPAQVSNVTQIFTRISIDLLLGLDETEEGYIGILDWTSEDTDLNAILNRANEIKELFEYTHPKALETIGKNQEKQIVTQNRSQNTSFDIIPIGKTVYLKCEGLLSKLEPRFKGPYKVIEFIKRGNYKVKNALDESLPESFPRHKLKVIENDKTLPEESAEIEKILKQKDKGNEKFTWLNGKIFQLLNVHGCLK